MDIPKKFLSDSIPPIFCKFETAQPFTHCTFCESELGAQSKYAVEKVFKQNKVVGTSEIVYEYAICWDCTANMGEDISDDSRTAIMNLFVSHRHQLISKIEFLHANELYTIDSWTERCSLTGKETRLCDEYSVSGIIEEGGLVFEQSPILVSDSFMEKLQSVLSKETKEKFDGMRDQILNDSPSVEDLIFSPTPGLI